LLNGELKEGLPVLYASVFILQANRKAAHTQMWSTRFTNTEILISIPMPFWVRRNISSGCLKTQTPNDPEARARASRRSGAERSRSTDVKLFFRLH
jgi:hypothetical protein